MQIRKDEEIDFRDWKVCLRARMVFDEVYSLIDLGTCSGSCRSSFDCLWISDLASFKGIGMSWFRISWCLPGIFLTNLIGRCNTCVILYHSSTLNNESVSWVLRPGIRLTDNFKNILLLRTIMFCVFLSCFTSRQTSPHVPEVFLFYPSFLGASASNSIWPTDLRPAVWAFGLNGLYIFAPKSLSV